MPYRWKAKARLIMAEGSILPDPARKEKTGEVLDPKNKIPVEPVRQGGESDSAFFLQQWNYETQVNDIDEEVPGWVYAKPLK